MSEHKGYDPFREDAMRKVDDANPQVAGVDPMDELMSVEESSPGVDSSTCEEWAPEAEEAPADDGRRIDARNATETKKDREKKNLADEVAPRARTLASESPGAKHLSGRLAGVSVMA